MAEQRTSGGGPDRRERRHEETALDGRRVFVFALAVVVLIAVALVVSLGVHDLLRLRPPLTSVAAGTQPAPSTPRLQVVPGQDLKAFTDEKRKLLNSYEWIDRDAGVVRIPIARAMALLVRNGEAAATPSKLGTQ